MPVVKTPPPSKKTTTAKPKGAVRAKSGCYTCRIRRKKCDERQNPDGNCETCVRLHLQCLGFGAKRPDWLRESSRVGVLREKIKNFLAAQGMIKGHAGTGSHGGRDEIFLRLTGEDYRDSSASESPPSHRPLSLSSPTNDFSRLHNTSSVRDEWDYDRTDNGHGLGLTTTGESYPSIHSANSSPRLSPPSLRGESPYANSPGYDNAYTYPTSNSVSIQYNPGIVPTSASSFSSHNTYHLMELDIFGLDDMEDYATMNGSTDQVMIPAPNYLSGPTMPLTPDDIHYYINKVINLQYVLFDRTNRDEILSRTVYEPGVTQDAAKILAFVHYLRQEKATPRAALESTEVKRRFDPLQRLLSQEQVSGEDAIASLHVVSSYLFDGGRGDWARWLRVACTFCDGLFSSRFSNGVVDGLMTCSNSERFLVKTSIWFDVLASVSTFKPPHFLHAVRQFCSPSASIIQDSSSTGLPPQLSMMTVMGCENIVVWAISEASGLAAWKQLQLNKGCLSLPDLVQKGNDIESQLPLATPYALHSVLSDETAVCREQTSHIFLAAARLYIRSVVSGDYPYVREIQKAVQETIDRLQYVLKHYPHCRGAIVRSAVFAVFLCGALTDDEGHRKLIKDLLSAESGPGNCDAVAELLQDVWGIRNNGIKRREPVPWRTMLHEAKLLLV